MKLFLAIATLVIVALVAPLFYIPAGGKPVASNAIGLPWQIETLADGGTRVFGLVPGRSTLADARRQLGDDLELAIVAAPGESGSIEAYYTRISAGFVTGSLVLTLAADPATIAAMLGRALKTEYMDSTTRRSRLHPDDVARALVLPVTVIGFMPTVNVDADTLLQRFGPPAERLRTGENMEHLLYPERGVDLAIDSRGKEFFQYVAISDFARLRAPLLLPAKAAP